MTIENPKIDISELEKELEGLLQELDYSSIVQLIVDRNMDFEHDFALLIPSDTYLSLTKMEMAGVWGPVTYSSNNERTLKEFIRDMEFPVEYLLNSDHSISESEMAEILRGEQTTLQDRYHRQIDSFDQIKTMREFIKLKSTFYQSYEQALKMRYAIEAIGNATKSISSDSKVTALDIQLTSDALKDSCVTDILGPQVRQAAHYFVKVLRAVKDFEYIANGNSVNMPSWLPHVDAEDIILKQYFKGNRTQADLFETE